MTSFKSSVFILPGLGNSGSGHWQTIWEELYGFKRIQQSDWDTPVCEDWITTMEASLTDQNCEEVILVAHSLACTTVAAWAARYQHRIKGALLVALSDTEAKSYPPGTTGFNPMHLNRLPFPSIAVTSNDDFYVTAARAKYFTDCWGSEFINIGNAGHINVASGHGHWPEGIELLQRIDHW